MLAGLLAGGDGQPLERLRDGRGLLLLLRLARRRSASSPARAASCFPAWPGRRAPWEGGSCGRTPRPPRRPRRGCRGLAPRRSGSLSRRTCSAYSLLPDSPSLSSFREKPPPEVDELVEEPTEGHEDRNRHLEDEHVDERSDEEAETPPVEKSADYGQPPEEKQDAQRDEDVEGRPRRSAARPSAASAPAGTKAAAAASGVRNVGEGARGRGRLVRAPPAARTRRRGAPRRGRSPPRTRPGRCPATRPRHPVEGRGRRLDASPRPAAPSGRTRSSPGRRASSGRRGARPGSAPSRA